MKIAITGATGFVGHALLEAAVAAGFAVVALARREQSQRKGVEWVRGDLDDRAALARLVAGCEAVVHLAGVVSAADTQAFEDGNVTGTMNLIEAMRAIGTARLIAVSSLTAREPGLSAYGASKARAETIVKASGLDWTLVRPPGIYGPRDKDYFEMFRLARLGLLPVPPRGGRSSLIHVDDLAQLLLNLIPGGEGRSHLTFEPDDGKLHGWSHYELARAIGWAVGRRPWVVHLSRPALERLSRAERAVRRGKARLTADRVGYMAHPDWVVNAAARPPRALWRPQIPTRDGLRATALWYRAHKWL